MYSRNAAYQAGRKIGRRYRNAGASNNELLAAVLHEVGPQIRPRNQRLAKEAVQRRDVTVSLGALALVCIAVLLSVVLFEDADWMPDVARELPQEYLALAVLVMVVFTAGSGLAYGVAAGRARREIRALREDLIRAAHDGALEVVSEERPAALSQRGKVQAQQSSRDTSGEDPTAMTPRRAELLAARWMRSLGATDAAVTQFRGDGGVDVSSSRYIAQVKHYSGNVGVAPVRELSGVVRFDGRRGLFFATAGYSKGAVEFANASGIALFVMEWTAGQLLAVNSIASALQKHGLQS